MAGGAGSRYGVTQMPSGRGPDPSAGTGLRRPVQLDHGRVVDGFRWGPLSVFELERDDPRTAATVQSCRAFVIDLNP